MRTMKYGSAFPSPFLPPMTPAPSPCVYTPHHRKYVPIHSGGIELKPSRAKRRISASPSQGFFSRLSRSTRCAFVSVPFVDIKKPTASIGCWRWVKLPLLIKNLDQQPPCTRHTRTTTTKTTTCASLARKHHLDLPNTREPRNWCQSVPYPIWMKT